MVQGNPNRRLQGLLAAMTPGDRAAEERLGSAPTGVAPPAEIAAAPAPSAAESGWTFKRVRARHEELAAKLSKAWSARLRSPVAVQLALLEPLEARTLTASLGSFCCVHVLKSQALGKIAIDLPMALTYGMLERLLGGKGTPVSPQREPTPLEWRLIRLLSAPLAAGLAEAWRGDDALTFALRATYGKPTDIRWPADRLMVAGLAVEWSGHRGMVHLAFPAAWMAPVSAAPTAAPAPLAVGMRATITVHELLNLGMGDVIPVGKVGDRVTLSLAGQEVGTGRLGQARGARAVLVEKTAKA